MKKKKKKSNRNSKSVCSSSFPTPTPIVPVLSRFDFSKATASLSLSFSLIIHRDRAFAQPSSFAVSPFSVFCKSDGGLTFFSELFIQTVVLSSGSFTNNFLKHVFGRPRLKGSLLFGFFLVHHSCFLSILLSFTCLKRHF